MEHHSALASGVVSPERADVPLATIGNVYEPPAIDDLSELDDLVSATSKIMIVDDEPTLILLVEKYLYDFGYRYFVKVQDATKAMSMIRKEKPDLILLDIVMPHVSGIDILHALRSDANLRQTPVIIVSAVSDAELRKTALRLRVSDFLGKPVDPHELNLRVRNALIVKRIKTIWPVMRKNLKEKSASGRPSWRLHDRMSSFASLGQRSFVTTKREIMSFESDDMWASSPASWGLATKELNCSNKRLSCTMLGRSGSRMPSS